MVKTQDNHHNKKHDITRLQQAISDHQAGRLKDAKEKYNKIIASDSKNKIAINNLGLILKYEGEVDAAIALFERAAALDSHYADPLMNLGNIYTSWGKFDLALGCFEKARQANPGHAPIYINLAILFESRGKLDNAIECARECLRINPNLPEGHLNLGNALQRSNRLDEAIASYDRAIALRPDWAIAYENLGAALKANGNLARSLVTLEKALRLQPDSTVALLHMGILMIALQRIEEAVAFYERILVLQPGNIHAKNNLLLDLNYLDSILPEALARRSCDIGAGIEREAFAECPQHDNQPDACKRLRVGYVSPDFRRHAVPYFLEPLLQAHNRLEVEIFCYAEVSAPDVKTARLQSLADHWRWTVGVSDDDVAAQIRADEIDILIDLAGHSAHNRLPVFARRPAPVQATWLGYPNTTGLTSIDYRLVDAITDPEGPADALASEKLVRIDGGFLCYQPPDGVPEPAAAPVLENGFITFGSFNNLAKLSNTTLQVWGRLLAVVPTARLLLKSMHFRDEDSRTQMLARLSKHGIAPERVVLLGSSDTEAEQMAAYHQVDIALDTFPYNGTTTTCETLWMGVPVVALLGDSHRARVSASLLTRVGCTDLIASDHDDYVRIAAELAADPVRLQTLHEQLRPRMASSSLCDAPSFARNMETAYRRIWQCWCAGRTPVAEDKTSNRDEFLLRVADGTLLAVPPSLNSYTTYILLEQERWFEKEADFVFRWLRPGMTAIDIGANLGIYSLPMARAVGSEGQVFSYEPTEDTFALLTYNRNINQANNLVVVQAALSDRTGIGCLAHGSSSELNRLCDDNAGERVRITCLDDEDRERQWRSPDFIKIDAEGHETAILRGGAEFFMRHSPLVMFEINKGQTDYTSPQHSLKALGYGLYRLLAGAPVLVPHTGDILDAYELNLFAAKPDRAATMAQEGWLVEALPEWKPDSHAGQDALKPLRQLPCMLAFKELLSEDLKINSSYLECLAAFATWRLPDMPVPIRCAALDFAWRGLLLLNEQPTTFARLLTLARVASEAGQREVSVRALRHFLEAIKNSTLLMTEPFWPASARFDTMMPDGNIRDWIVGSLDKTIADTHQVTGAIWTLGKNLAGHALKNRK